MARPGTGWEIPTITKYHTSSDVMQRNTEDRITENVFGKKIRGRPARVIAQLIQIKIQEDYKKKKLILNNHQLSIIAFFEEIRQHLWKWKDHHYSIDKENGDNGV